jgi:antitoxin component YwqK of YwqJK toxin-antitoxin module
MKTIKSKNAFMSLLLLYISFGFAQTAPNALDSKGERHGQWQGFFDDSKILRYEGKFNHGKEVGMFTYYANSDKKIVKATRNFDGKGNAYTIFFDEKSNKVSEGNMANKLRQGVWKYYHKGAKTIMTTENYVNDKIEGVRKVFYTTGIVGEEIPYKNNLKEGVSKKFNKDGKLIEESVFVKGLLQGPYKVYDEGGNVVISGKFKDDKKKGIWQYFEGGKLVREINTDTINGHKKPSLKTKQ